MTRAKQGKRAASKARAVKPPRHTSKIVEGERIVDDPYEPGVKVKARVNLAEHPLELMRARGRIDDAQYEAGIRFRAIYERASIGPGGGIDPSRIRVDGGAPGDAFTDDIAMALNDLRRLSRDLGMVGYRVVQAVAGQGEHVSDLAERWTAQEAVRARRDYLTIRLREALDVLALEIWGAVGPARC